MVEIVELSPPSYNGGSTSSPTAAQKCNADYSRHDIIAAVPTGRNSKQEGSINIFVGTVERKLDAPEDLSGETAGAAAGAVGGAVIGGAIGGPFGAAIGGAIGAGIGTQLFGGKTTKNQIIDVLNETLAETIVQTTAECQVSAALIQEQIAECDPSSANVPNDRGFIQNESCVSCAQSLRAIKNEYALYKERAAGAGVDVATLDAQLTQQEADDLANFLNATDENGIPTANSVSSLCEVVCAACIFSNNKQKAQLQINLQCVVDADLEVAIKNSFATNVEQKFKNEKDVLANLAEALGGTDGDSDTTVKVANKAVNLLETGVLNKILVSVKATQQQRIAPGSYSTIFAGNRQENDIKVVASAIAKNAVFEKILNEDQTKIYQDILDKNNTVGDITDEINKTLESIGKGFKVWMYALIGFIALLFIGAAIAMFLVMRNKRANNTKQPLLPTERTLVGNQSIK